MIQPTLVSFMDIRSGLKGHMRSPRREVTSSPGSCHREGQGPCEESTTTYGFGQERTRPPMKGSPEHLLLQEARVVTGGQGQQDQCWDPGEKKTKIPRTRLRNVPRGRMKEEEGRHGSEVGYSLGEVISTKPRPQRFGEEGRKPRLLPRNPSGETLGSQFAARVQLRLRAEDVSFWRQIRSQVV